MNAAEGSVDFTKNRDDELRQLFEKAANCVCELFPEQVEYIRSCYGYQREYMLPLVAWMLDEGCIKNVVDIGYGYGVFPVLCKLAGFNVFGVNQKSRVVLYPFRRFELNILDGEAGATVSEKLPGGDDTLYSCMEVVEHNDQNILPGLTGLFSKKPRWCFFTTSLAGTQGCPERTPWQTMPEWDGESTGSLSHVSGWFLDDLVSLGEALGYRGLMAEKIRTCADGLRPSRLVYLGERGE